MEEDPVRQAIRIRREATKMQYEDEKPSPIIGRVAVGVAAVALFGSGYFLGYDRAPNEKSGQSPVTQKENYLPPGLQGPLMPSDR